VSDLVTPDGTPSTATRGLTPEELDQQVRQTITLLGRAGAHLQVASSIPVRADVLLHLVRNYILVDVVGILAKEGLPAVQHRFAHGVLVPLVMNPRMCKVLDAVGDLRPEVAVKDAVRPKLRLVLPEAPEEGGG